MSNTRESFDTDPEEYDSADDMLVRLKAWSALFGGSLATAGYGLLEFYLPTIMELLRECGQSPRFGSAHLALLYMRLMLLGTGIYLLNTTYQNQAGLNCGRNTIFYHQPSDTDDDENDEVELDRLTPDNRN